MSTAFKHAPRSAAASRRSRRLKSTVAAPGGDQGSSLAAVCRSLATDTASHGERRVTDQLAGRAAQPGPSAPPQYSADGQWWWTGDHWVAAPAPAHAPGFLTEAQRDGGQPLARIYEDMPGTMGTPGSVAPAPTPAHRLAAGQATPRSATEQPRRRRRAGHGADPGRRPDHGRQGCRVGMPRPQAIRLTVVALVVITVILASGLPLRILGWWPR